MRRPVAVALASSALLLACRLAAAVDDPDRARAPKRCRRASPPTTPTATSRRTTRATSPRRSRSPSTARASPAQLAAFQRRIEAVDGRRPRHPVHRAPSREVAYANFALAGPALGGESQDARRRDPRPRPARRHATTARLRQHRPLHRPEAEPDRPRAAGRRDHRDHHPDPALPAHRLGPAAAQDAADEHADPRRHARHPRPRLPGGLARRAARLHRPGRDRGDQPRLPLRGHLRPRHRLRGAGDGADQGAARPRRQQRGGGGDRHRPHRPRDHRRRAGDRRRLPRLRRSARSSSSSRSRSAWPSA